MTSRSHAEFGMSSRTAEEGIRLVGHSHSVDFFHWAPDPPRRIMVPDERDSGVFEFYSVRAVPYENFTLGMVKVLRDDLPALAVTYDGLNWNRFREPFLDRNPDAAAWDRAHAWIDAVINVGDQTYFYYGGYKGGHKVNRHTERLIGMARLRRDGFVSLDARGESEGVLVTRPLAIDARKLTVNAQVSGRLTVRLLDVHGKAIEGYESQPITGDSVEHEVSFARPLAIRATDPVRVEVTIRAGRLYGIEFR